VKKKLLAAAMVCLLHACPAFAGLVGPDGFKRARIAEIYNSPAAQLLIMLFDPPLREIAPEPPSWQTVPVETVSDIERAGDIFTISAFDMIITGDQGYAESLESRNLAKKSVPIWKERLVLVGPHDRKADMEGLPVPDIMRRISDENALFFSLIMDGFVRKSEDDLWKKANALSPAERSGYVETSRDGLSALIQAGDEGAFVLIGEGTYAQYVELERFEPVLARIAETEYFRTTFACLLEHSGFRKIRADSAAKYLEWFQGESASLIISDFSVGGLKPFIPIEAPESRR
jgi:ABC-type tungstate transport system permease subunit